MESIIDDFNILYNSIIEDITSEKSEKCIYKSSLDNNYNCSSGVYNINKNDIKNKLTIDENNDNSSIRTYLKNINNNLKKILDDFQINSTNINCNEFNNNNENIKNNISIIISSYSKKINNSKNIIIITSIITGLIILYILKYNIWDYLFSKQKKNAKTFKKYIINNLSVITFIGSLYYTVVYSNIISNLKILENKKKSLNKINETSICNILTDIVDLRNTLNDIFKDVTYTDYNSELTPKLYNIINKYKKLDKESLINNDYTKYNKIDEINSLFKTFKNIAYINNNKFNSLTIDNHNEIECLMNLILIKNKSEYIKDITIKCELSNQYGFKGLYDSQYNSQFKNGLENIENIEDEVNIFFDKLRTLVLDQSIKYKLNKSKLFKVILNLFMIKIKYYNIKQSECVKYIYHYFENYDLDRFNITISKFEIINNYKILISIIFNHYEQFINTHHHDIHNVPGYIINKSKFSQIMSIYSINEIKKLNNVVQETITKINDFNSIYKNDILKDIEKEKNSNNVLFVGAVSFSIISFLQLIGYVNIEIEDISNQQKRLTKQKGGDKTQTKNQGTIIINKPSDFAIAEFANGDIAKVNKSAKTNMVVYKQNTKSKNVFTEKNKLPLNTSNIEFTELEWDQILKLGALSSIVLFLNILIFSYYTKKSLNTNYKELSTKNNSNSFFKKLEQLHEYFNLLVIIKQINTNNSIDIEYMEKNIKPILEEFNIKYNINDNNKLILSLYNSGGDYTILNKIDVENIINEKIYYSLSNVIKEYECCSYFKKNNKEVLFPYTEVSINIIFYSITMSVILYILTNKDLQPLHLLNKISKKKNPNQIGGLTDRENNLISKENIIYIISIYMFLGISYKIYTNTLKYKTSLYN